MTGGAQRWGEVNVTALCISKMSCMCQHPNCLGWAGTQWVSQGRAVLSWALSASCRQCWGEAVLSLSQELPGAHRGTRKGRNEGWGLQQVLPTLSLHPLPQRMASAPQ